MKGSRCVIGIIETPVTWRTSLILGPGILNLLDQFSNTNMNEKEEMNIVTVNKSYVPRRTANHKLTNCQMQLEKRPTRSLAILRSLSISKVEISPTFVCWKYFGHFNQLAKYCKTVFVSSTKWTNSINSWSDYKKKMKKRKKEINMIDDKKCVIK